MPNPVQSAQLRLPLGLDYSAVMEAFSKYVAEERPRLVAPADVAALMRPVLAAKPQEEFQRKAQELSSGGSDSQAA